MTFTARLAEALTKARSQSPGAELSISLLRVRDGATLFASNADIEHDAASTMKMPLVVATYRQAERGLLDLQAPVRIHNSFTSQVGGKFGVEQDEDSDGEVWDRMGQEVTLEWLCRRCIIRSSNLATNLVLDQVGISPVNEVIADAGADGITVVRGIGNFAAGEQGLANRITTRGLSAIMVALAQQRLASAETSTAVLKVLAANEMATDIRAGLPDGTFVVHKNGWIIGAIHDTALFRTPGDEEPGDELYVLTVATTSDWSAEQAHAFIQAIAALVWDERGQLAGASAA